MKKNQKNEFSVLSFVFGIISIIVTLIMYISVKCGSIGYLIMLMVAPTIGPIVFICILLAILFGSISLKSDKRKFSIIGLSSGILSIIIFVIFVYEMVKIIMMYN